MFAETNDYLCHAICLGRLKLVHHSTAGIAKVKHPTAQTEPPSFLNLGIVFKPIVSIFARLTTPVNERLSKGQRISSAVLDKKERAVERLLLALPNGTDQYTLDTTSCELHIGCVLLLKDKE